MGVDWEDGNEAEGAQIGDEGGEARRVIECVYGRWSRAQEVLVCRVGFEGGAFVDEKGGPGAGEEDVVAF